MRACSGTWIAHGAGSADRDTVDRHDHVMVPPENPSYRIRRVWLSQEEEQGYYFGFANEGLWPLCHIAHTRPTFRAPDWEHYQTVNRRFADVVADEARTDDPIVLVQDYHFALLPRMVRERLPRATIITFWHIPWPNPEASASARGARKCWRACSAPRSSASTPSSTATTSSTPSTASSRRASTARRSPSPTAATRPRCAAIRSRSNGRRSALALQPPVAECRKRVRERLGLRRTCARRRRRPARLHQGHPRALRRDRAAARARAALDRPVLVHPGRRRPRASSIDEYQNLERARARAGGAHQRALRPPGCAPIVLRSSTTTRRRCTSYYRAADLCYVSSLHDGMNLVAKEFVAARDDEQGVLILSQFTGAARDLAEALIVNPYDIEQSAAAMHLALTMSPDEQRARMRSMREPGAGVQRLPLGRAHAARRRAHAPPQPRDGARARRAAPRRRDA